MDSNTSYDASVLKLLPTSPQKSKRKEEPILSWKGQKWRGKKEYIGKGSSKSDRKALRERQETETQGKVAELGAKGNRKIL